MPKIGVFLESFTRLTKSGSDLNNLEPIPKSIESLISLSVQNDLYILGLDKPELATSFLEDYRIGEIINPEKWLLEKDINEIIIKINGLGLKYFITGNYRTVNKLKPHLNWINIINVGSVPICPDRTGKIVYEISWPSVPKHFPNQSDEFSAAWNYTQHINYLALLIKAI